MTLVTSAATETGILERAAKGERRGRDKLPPQIGKIRNLAAYLLKPRDNWPAGIRTARGMDEVFWRVSRDGWLVRNRLIAHTRQKNRAKVFFRFRRSHCEPASQRGVRSASWRCFGVSVFQCVSISAFREFL